MTNEFNNILTSLELLRTVTPDTAFSEHMRKVALPNRVITSSFSLFSPLRLAIILLAILFIGTGSVVFASTNSKPGQFLYPVKQVVTNATLHFSSKPIQQKIETKPILSPTPRTTAVPTSNTYGIQSKSSSVDQTNNSVSVTPTLPPTTATPTPTTAMQTHASTSVNVSAQVTGTPINVNLSVGSKSPSGNGDDNAGSKDNNPDAEDTTSLLPHLSVNTPIVHLGL
jgi:hypothetical protein